MADGLRRVAEAYGALRPQQRLALWAAAGLFGTMFLPWYSTTLVTAAAGSASGGSGTLSAFESFSFVEAAVLLVAAGVIVMLLARGADRGFHLPGGDGTVVIAAGVWVCLLVFYRQFDKPDVIPPPKSVVTVGVSWGIFVTFLLGLALAAAGNALRAAHVAEPPLPTDGGGRGGRAESGPHGDAARPVRRRPGAAERTADARRRMPPEDQAPTVVSPRGGEGPPGGEQLRLDTD